MRASFIIDTIAHVLKRRSNSGSYCRLEGVDTALVTAQG
jgi:hypothetical protein